MASNLSDKLMAIFDEEYSSFLSDVASGATKQMLSNFDKEKDVNGEPFEPLKDSTRKERRSKGYGGSHPILKRTKNLRNNIKVEANMATKSFTLDPPFYADFLNDGRSDMEPRKIVELPDDWNEGGSKRRVIFNKLKVNLENRLIDAINIFKEE